MKLAQPGPSSGNAAVRMVSLVAVALLLLGAILEFFQIAWGTGVSLGQFSLKWALALAVFVLFCVLCLVVIASRTRLENLSRPLAEYRDRLGIARYLLAALFLLAPVYVLQYTFWGIVVHGPFLRILLGGTSVLLLGWILTKGSGRLLSWQSLLVSLVLASGVYTFFVPLVEVTSYPFSLAWSEGNRLWDYSILFGRHLYEYPAGEPIPVLLDRGRRIVGGLPFLLPELTIWQARLWLALVDTVPYLLLGWAAFRLDRDHFLKWLLAGIWAFTFVRQGPIHPPLLLSAIVVALAWGRPLWLALPLIAIASYFAEISRLTWMFAPGLWAAMLELNRIGAQPAGLDRKTWARAISAGAAGVLGGYVIPFLAPGFLHWASSLAASTVASPAGESAVVPELSSRVSATISTQPLLWSRLLPNATYGEGILIGLALAVLPLIVVLAYFATRGQWSLNLWQRLAIVLPLLAFLVVGLIASVKIGGGADLHNMDMFIIGLMFAGAIAWRAGAHRWVEEIHTAPFWAQLALVLMIVIPGYRSLVLLRPIQIHEDLTTVARLADIVEDPLPNPLPDTVASAEDTERALQRIQQEVAQAAENGEVLFMDQRQLLTFGYVTGVPLVPEYDKKVLINEAMSANTSYFETFYKDLASQRFSLIITNPVNRRLDRSEGHFSEENNAWVKWVSTPLLCYYEPLDRLKRVDVELLVPRKDISDCQEILPTSPAE